LLPPDSFDTTSCLPACLPARFPIQFSTFPPPRQIERQLEKKRTKKNKHGKDGRNRDKGNWLIFGIPFCYLGSLFGSLFTTIGGATMCSLFQMSV